MERGLVKTSSGYVHYRAAGSGRPVILIHLSHRSSAMYESTIENLSDAGRFYAIDLPGQGYSDAFPERPTLPGMVNVISEFCEAIGAKSVVLGGHAVGSIISIEVAARRPELVDACILQSTPFYTCLLYTSPSPRDRTRSRMPSSA